MTAMLRFSHFTRYHTNFFIPVVAVKSDLNPEVVELDGNKHMLPSPMKKKFIDISLSFWKYYVSIDRPGRLGRTVIDFDLQVPYNNFGRDVGCWCVGP